MRSTSAPFVGSIGADARGVVQRVFGEPRFHTAGDLLALTFAPDGPIWSVEEPGLLRQWDTSTGQDLRQHVLSDLETLWVFSGDARLLASASDDLTLWEVGTGQVVCTVPQESWVTTASFGGPACDPPPLATGHDDGKVRLWDTGDGILVHELSGHHLPVSALAFSADGAKLASAGEDRLIQLWDVKSGRQLGTLRGHTDRIPALAWHPHGHQLVSAGWDTTARVWNAVTGEPVILLNSHADQVTVLAFSPDGRLLACGDSAASIHVWDPASWQTIHVLRGQGEEEMRCLAFDRAGRRLASGGTGRAIHLWDIREGRVLAGDDGQVVRHSISVSAGPSGPCLASNCGGAALRVWDTAEVKSLLPVEANSACQAAAASPDGRWIAAGRREPRIDVWDVGSRQLQASLTGPMSPIAVLAFAPNSQLLASASAADGTVWLWNMTNREPVLLIPEAADGCSVEALAFDLSSRRLACGGIDWLATGGSDGAVCLWDVVQPRKVAVFSGGATSVAFHPSGRWLAVARLDELVAVWEVESQALCFELRGHTERVAAVAYSPDGRWLASGSEDRSVRLWDAASGELAAVHELDTPIEAVAFSPDSAYLFTGNGNTTCYQMAVQRLLP